MSDDSGADGGGPPRDAAGGEVGRDDQRRVGGERPASGCGGAGRSLDDIGRMSSKKIKRAKRRVHERSRPVDVSRLRRLTANEKAAQKCDPRSWVAEQSEWPWIPAHFSVSHPNLGGRRVFVHAYNTRFTNAARLRDSGMQRPNMKAVHLYNCCLHWDKARRLREQIVDGGSGNPDVNERISCDLMCAAALSLYSFSATIETFCNDMEDAVENEGEVRFRLKDRLKNLLKKHHGGKLPGCYGEFTRLHDARNALTHNTSKGGIVAAGDDFGQHEGLGQAIESVLRVKVGPPEIAAELMEVIAGKPATRWVRELLERVDRDSAESRARP